MDEIDRPRDHSCDVPAPRELSGGGPQSRTPARSFTDEIEAYDEVDRPIPTPPLIITTNSVDEVRLIDFNDDESRSAHASLQDYADYLPVEAGDLDANNRRYESFGGMLIIDQAVDDSFVVIQDTSDLESVDGPPVPIALPSEAQVGGSGADLGSPGAAIDGPFSKLYFKQSKPAHNVLTRKDSDGIVTSHATYYPNNKPKHPAQYRIDSNSFYNMDTFPRGRLVLVNEESFKKSSGMAEYPRDGTSRDADALTALFLDLGFIVERHDNITKREMINVIKVAANESYKDLSCFACAVLSHGDEGIIYGTDGYVRLKELSQAMKSPTLVGKPKFVIVQACQGNEYMESVDAVDGPGRGGRDTNLALPSEADFLYAYSTVPGFYSWRNSKRGSWFVQGLVQVFRENVHKMDVARMFTRVNALISTRRSRTDDFVTDNKRQIASIVNQMRKEFYLFPPSGPLEPLLDPEFKIDI